jgi:hypothetical protein
MMKLHQKLNQQLRKLRLRNKYQLKLIAKPGLLAGLFCMRFGGGSVR